MIVFILFIICANIVLFIIQWVSNPSIWYFSLAGIIDCMILIWIASGAQTAFDLEKKLKNEKKFSSDTDEEKMYMIQVLAKKMNMSLVELKEAAFNEMVDERKDIKLSALPYGYKVILIKDIQTTSGTTFKHGTVGRIESKEGNRYNLSIEIKGVFYKLTCREEEIMNYYYYKSKNRHSSN